MVPANSSTHNAMSDPDAAAAIVRSVPGCFVVLGADDRIVAVSERSPHMLRRSIEELTGQSFASLLPRDDIELFESHIDLARHSTGQEVRGRIRVDRPDGAPIRVTAVFHAIGSGPLAGHVAVRLDSPPPVNPRDHFRSEDLTEWQLGIHELISASAAPELIFDAIVGMVEHHLVGSCAIGIYSGAGSHWNLKVECAPSTAQITDLSVKCSRPIMDLARTSHAVIDTENPVDEVDRLGQMINRRLADGHGAVWTAPVLGVSDSSPLGAIFVQIQFDRPATAIDREVLRIAGHLAGLTVERHRDERWLANQTLFDPLTGLARRSLLVDRAEQAFRRMADEQVPLAAIFLQVIEFHLVNSTFGHHIGDEVLQICAQRIASKVADTDTVARFSGDEFVVLTHDPDPTSLANILLNSVSTPIRLESGEVVHLHSRIGVARPSLDDTSDTLIRNANAAMQWSRQPGSGSVVTYDSSIRSRSIEQFALRGDLHRCVSRGELRVHYQPKVDVDTGLISGAEALLRWHHPVHGLLSPDRFISLAEESDVIVDIGLWVLRESVRQAAEWRDHGVIDEHFLLAVNMSAVQLWSDSFADDVATVLKEFDWAPQMLSLELTETLLASNYDELLAALAKLKSLGILLAADDFGTGYSALTYLDQLPLDVLKVDKGFVARLCADGTGSVVASGVVSMARDLGLRTCAEGVETIEQLNGLQVLGCDWAQGYHIARPLTPDAFAALTGKRTVWR